MKGQLLQGLSQHIHSRAAGESTEWQVKGQLAQGVPLGDLIEPQRPGRTTERTAQQHLQRRQQGLVQLTREPRAGHLVPHQGPDLAAEGIALEIQLLQDRVHQRSKTGSPRQAAPAGILLFTRIKTVAVAIGIKPLLLTLGGHGIGSLLQQSAVTPASPAACRSLLGQWLLVSRTAQLAFRGRVGRWAGGCLRFQLDAKRLAAAAHLIQQIRRLFDQGADRLPRQLPSPLALFGMQQPGRQAGAAVLDATPVDAELVLGARQGHIAQA